MTDATVRSESGRATQPNPAFLNPELAMQEFVQPALKGLGPKLGAQGRGQRAAVGGGAGWEIRDQRYKSG